MRALLSTLLLYLKDGFFRIAYGENESGIESYPEATSDKSSHNNNNSNNSNNDKYIYIYSNIDDNNNDNDNVNRIKNNNYATYTCVCTYL